MKLLGYILIITGLVLFIFMGYVWFTQRNTFVSPLPNERGVKVIFITPTE